jgi:hypothetical protein
MTVNDAAGWSDSGWQSWENLSLVRARLDAGADPNQGAYPFESPLLAAAERGSPEVVAELAGRVDDVDADYDGRTALWAAVFHDRPENVRALVAAGADPWRPMMSGWSPGRLSLAGPMPGLFFPFPPGHARLTEAETAAVAEADRLIGVLGGIEEDGFSLACVHGIGAAEAARRLAAEPADAEEVEEILEDPYDDEAMRYASFTDVPGGCVVSQEYGEAVGWDTVPGGGDASATDTAEEILLKYLYAGHAVAYCFAGAGLTPADGTLATTDLDTYLRLPERDHWS